MKRAVKTQDVMLVKIVHDEPVAKAAADDTPISYVAGKAVNTAVCGVASGIGAGVNFMFSQLANFGRGVVGSDRG